MSEKTISEELQELADRGQIQDFIDENERRIKRGEQPLDVERLKVWLFLDKYFPSLDGKVDEDRWNTAGVILTMLKEKNWPIDREHVDKVMAIIENDSLSRKEA